MPTYILPTRGFYREGRYYRAGDPFELPDGCAPQRDAVLVEDAPRPRQAVKSDVFAMSDAPSKPKRTSES